VGGDNIFSVFFFRVKHSQTHPHSCQVQVYVSTLEPLLQ